MANKERSGGTDLADLHLVAGCKQMGGFGQSAINDG